MNMGKLFGYNLILHFLNLDNLTLTECELSTLTEDYYQPYHPGFKLKLIPIFLTY